MFGSDVIQLCKKICKKSSFHNLLIHPTLDRELSILTAARTDDGGKETFRNFSFTSVQRMNRCNLRCIVAIDADFMFCEE